MRNLFEGTIHLLVSSPGDPRGCSHFSAYILPTTTFFSCLLESAPKAQMGHNDTELRPD